MDNRDNWKQFVFGITLLPAVYFIFGLILVFVYYTGSYFKKTDPPECIESTRLHDRFESIASLVTREGQELTWIQESPLSATLSDTNIVEHFNYCLMTYLEDSALLNRINQDWEVAQQRCLEALRHQ